MRVLVCGSRDWTDTAYMVQSLEEWDAAVGFSALIEGEAIGADEIAARWAESAGIEVLTRDPWIHVRPNKLTSTAVNQGIQRGFPALWDEHGRSAGPRRNTEMLKQGPQFAIAFCRDIKTSRGTRNMVEQLDKAGVPYVILPGFQRL